MLSEDEVRRICRLARIQVSEAELALLKERFAKVLTHFDALAAVNTQDVAPMYHGTDVMSLREDVAEAPIERDLLTQNAPDAYDGCFRIPKVVGGVET